MPKTQTKIQAGALVAAYVENSLGRQLVLGDPARGVIDQPLLIGKTQAEVKEVIRVMRELAQELPPG